MNGHSVHAGSSGHAEGGIRWHHAERGEERAENSKRICQRQHQMEMGDQRPQLQADSDSKDQNISAPIPSHEEIKAYALEDKVEALSANTSTWHVGNLSQWRKDAYSQDTKQYIRTRQRAYKRALLQEKH